MKQEEYFEFIRRDGEQASSLTASLELNRESSLGSKYVEIGRQITDIGKEWEELHAKSPRTAEE